MPKRKTETFESPKLKRIGTEEHHCSQCNRPKLHEVFEHEDGVLMKCPCGYKFVDVRASANDIGIDNDSDKS